MELTGKCKEEFLSFMIENVRKIEGVGSRFFDETIIQEFEKWPDSFKHGLMIDFFDSVGILFSIKSIKMFYPGNLYKSNIEFKCETIDCHPAFLSSRAECVSRAMSKANYEYNLHLIQPAKQQLSWKSLNTQEDF